ncbi:prepilin-type N-terminal cleavage/methylation domain-containing protein [Ectobacillus panaciterrae]|uniref:prepilin-type N-terminal cleavage/methylation domain-containing protein n=1 Tax=Ectobacillus panaciterrae TaxID=363872 RepID=UPI000408B37F|nr:prepilin-type N-terminal cleavage/methylation domain-containing protein [Ectobacillus panaciterrae]
MQKKCENGLTLVEVLASITILSIITIGLFAVFPKAYLFTKENQSKTVAVNIARGVLHYFEKQDYDLLHGYLLALPNHNVAIIDSTAICSEEKPIQLPDNITETAKLFPDAEKESCEKILSPTVNGLTYDKNIQVFLLPSNWGDQQASEILDSIKKAQSGKRSSETISNTLKKLQESDANKTPSTTDASYSPIRMLVYVDLNATDDKEGVLLEGSIAHESIR